MKLSDIRSTLSEIRVSPVKSLGQNFLHDRNLSRWIVEQADIGPEDYVVEIGPGLGSLTEFILAKGARVLAIEKDGRLAEFLRNRFTDQRLEVLHADAMDFDLRSLFTEPRVKLLGNLPYNIASQLLVKYLEYPSPISLWLFMLQLEMAQRLSAKASSKDYGALSLQIQFHYNVKYLRRIPASVFFPAPEVDSAIVQVIPREPTDVPECNYGDFVELVRRGFSQRRKQLGSLLRKDAPDWAGTAATLGFNPKARAETLSLEQWAVLTNQVRPVAVFEGNRAQSERFPVVDATDTVLRSAPRAEVHGNNLRHRAVHMLIFNSAGEVFLQKRSRWKDRHPLCWDSSAAGHVNAGEEYEIAAKRELQEELGIAVALEKIAELPASEKTGQEFIWLFRGESEGPFILDRGEIETGAFFPPAVITGWQKARPCDFAPGFVECWKLLHR